MEQVIGVFAPIFCITLLGYGCGRLNLLGEAGPKILSRFVFFVSMPPLIFITLAKRQVSEIANWGYLSSYFLSILIGAVVFFLIARLFFKESGANLALGIFASINGNAGYLGIPICLFAFGSPLPAILATIIHMVCVYPILMTWIEIDLAKKSGAPITSITAKVGHIFIVVLKNPLLMATMLGVLAVITGLKLPEWSSKTLTLLGHGAIPIAIFALGLTLSEKGADTKGADRLEIAASCIIKLFLIPSLAFGFGHFVFHLDKHTLAALVFVAALPSPKNALILAQSYGVYIRRAALTVMTTTIAAAITLPIILYAFGELSVSP